MRIKIPASLLGSWSSTLLILKTGNQNTFQGSRYVTEDGGDIFVKENPKGEGAKKMFDGEFCSLQVIILCEVQQLKVNQHHLGLTLSGTMGYRSCQGS